MLDILLVDDEPTIRLSVGDALEDAGHRVTLAADGDAAAQKLTEHRFDVVVSDIRMPGLDGLSLFRRIRERAPETDVILITAYGAVEDAVQALKEGARDYLTKPFDTGELLLRVERLAERHALTRALQDARRALAENARESIIIGRSPPMIRLLERIETFAAADAPVLILGESGTGKELVARELHRKGPRAAGPFVPVHCAAFPETLIEAELFGHERGAFTGAVRRRDGRFRAADRGTLFLDEVAEIPLPAQAKLLRVLQEGVFEPLGTNTPVRVDVRIVSATHRDLKQCVADGTFREDLYYRLRVLDLKVPPLRARPGDLPLLVEHFLARFADDTPPTVSTAAWEALTRHDYPGNVRELEHAIQHACVLARGGEIHRRHLPDELLGDTPEIGEEPEEGGLLPLADAIGAYERGYLLRALRETGGRKTQAAELLGISRKNLWEKLKTHGVRDEEFG
ncbi:MAG: sigma-54 dependent transcriptional regulator [bacterium]